MICKYTSTEHSVDAGDMVQTVDHVEVSESSEDLENFRGVGVKMIDLV